MDIFDILTLIGGLCLFLFGMNLMGEGLEKRAGESLKKLLGKLTTGKLAGFLTGLGVTAIIQSSSATTVMVVGFVNSGLMTLRQSINVIMGANVGTTVTAWLLSLTGIESSNVFVKLLKPSSFTPLLALFGIILYMGFKSNKKKDTGVILLGFATLMFGMETMSGAVSGLKEVEQFTNILTLFDEPVLGVLAGAVLTAIIQSSSASVGILQALSSTGVINYGVAIPIIMGQNIGTCVTALLSSIGTNRNARRASVVHLSFNIIGTAVLLILFYLAKWLLPIDTLIANGATEFGIAVAHSSFNIICTILLLPASSLLEKLSYKIIPEPKKESSHDINTELDERLMATPAIAIDRCSKLTLVMAKTSVDAMKTSLCLLTGEKYSSDIADDIRQKEKEADHYEDILGSYLVKLGTYPMSDRDSRSSAKLLHVIGDFERISDHAVGILKAVEELREKEISFTESAQNELRSMASAVNEILDHAFEAFSNENMESANLVEPLEGVIDTLKEMLRSSHILRMQKGDCSIEAGFIWSDLLNDLERVSDHCSNIAGCVIEMTHDKLDLHRYLKNIRASGSSYADNFEKYSKKYIEGV